MAVWQELCLGLDGQDCNTVVTVQALYSCSSIATIIQIPLSTLLANNPNVNADCSNLFIGEVRSSHTAFRSGLNYPTGSVRVWSYSGSAAGWSVSRMSPGFREGEVDDQGLLTLSTVNHLFC